MATNIGAKLLYSAQWRAQRVCMIMIAMPMGALTAGMIPLHRVKNWYTSVQKPQRLLVSSVTCVEEIGKIVINH